LKQEGFVNMPYTTQKAELPEGFIDLGEEVPSMGMT
jgi:hypothetical protein